MHTKIATILERGKYLAFSPTARNTYVVFLGNGVSSVFAFIFTVTTARYLSYADFGYFSAMLTFLLLVIDVADIGIGTSMSRFLPPLRQRPKELLSFIKSAFVLQFFIILLTSIGVYFAAPSLTEMLFHDPQFEYLIRWSAFGIFVAMLGNFFSYTLSALQKFKAVGFLSFFGSLLRVLLLALLIVTAEVTLPKVSIVQITALGILALTALTFLKTEFLYAQFKKKHVTDLFHFTYNIGISRALTAIASKLDVLMLIALMNATEAGIYSVASRVISLFPLLAGSFSMVIAPRLASIKRKELNAFLFHVILGTLGIVTGIIVLIVIARPFMEILFGEKGVPAVEVFQLLLVSMIFFVGSIPSVSLVIYYLKKPFVLTVNAVLQLLIVAIGNYLLIPMYGKYGPAITSILAFGVTLVLTSWMSYYYLQKHHES